MKSTATAITTLLGAMTLVLGCAQRGPVYSVARAAEIRAIDFAEEDLVEVERQLIDGMAALAIDAAEAIEATEGAALVESPLIVRSTGPMARVRALEARFSQQFTHAARRAERNGFFDVERAALSSGPISDGGRRFATMRDYLEHITEVRSSVSGSRPFRLADAMREAIANAMIDRGLAPAQETDAPAATLAAIRRDVQEYAADAAAGTATRAYARRLGARFVIRSSLRPTLRGDRIRVEIIDLTTGQRHTAAKPIDPIFKAAIDRVTTEAR